MNRKEITQKLSKALEAYINPYYDTRIYFAKEVTFDYTTARSVRVDYMRFVPVNHTVSGIEQGKFYCYEIKSCVADFISKNGHNFIGDYNYYVMTQELYEQVKDKIPYFVGVYVLEGYNLLLKKKAKKQDRNRPVAEMLLMMFRSANRENIKNQKNVKDCEQK